GTLAGTQRAVFRNVIERATWDRSPSLKHYIGRILKGAKPADLPVVRAEGAVTWVITGDSCVTDGVSGSIVSPLICSRRQPAKLTPLSCHLLDWCLSRRAELVVLSTPETRQEME